IMKSGAESSTRSDSAVADLISLVRERGRADSYVGKRRWTRYALGMRLEVTPDPEKPGNTWVVRSHNISGGGLGFWSRQEVDRDITIFVRECAEDAAGGPWLRGRVTYCTLGISGYLVVVAFTTPMRPDTA